MSGKPIPETVAAEAAALLTTWLDEEECECEPYGHSCGRPNVIRVRDDLLALTAAQQQGQAVAWPTEAKHAGSGDWEARTSICAHTMSEAQARVWNACLAACKAANTAPQPSVPDDLLRQAAAVLERFRTLDDDAITVINRINKHFAAAPSAQKHKDFWGGKAIEGGTDWTGYD